MFFLPLVLASYIVQGIPFGSVLDGKNISLTKYSCFGRSTAATTESTVRRQSQSNTLNAANIALKGTWWGSKHGGISFLGTTITLSLYLNNCIGPKSVTTWI